MISASDPFMKRFYTFGFYTGCPKIIKTHNIANKYNGFHLSWDALTTTFK